MASIQRLISDIEEQKIGASTRRVLVVEGSNDVHAIEIFLTKKFSNWETDWVVAEAGNKTRVIEVLQQRPDWCGVVDPDEWTQEVIEQRQAVTPNLWVLPRYCLENYLNVPEELWQALPPKQQQKVTAGLVGLEIRITADLEKWICHGVLWSIVNPLWEGLRSRGFKEALLDPDIALDNQKIQDTLMDWHDYLEPNELFQRYQAKLAEVQLLSTEQKLQRWVHGKEFYKSVVNIVLNDLLGTKAADDRKKSIFRTSQVPDDFDPLWLKMGFPTLGAN